MRLISPSRLWGDCGVINLTLMDSTQEQSADALQSALRVAKRKKWNLQK